MFIHIGDDHLIRSRDIITIVEIDVITSSTAMEEMLTIYKENNRLIGSKEDAKSVIITDQKIYYSQLAVLTLKKRSSIVSMLSQTKEYVDELDID